MSPFPGPAEDKSALVQALFVKHASLIKGFVLALLPDFSLVDDVLHEVFLVVVEKANTFQEGTSFLAWTRAIARLKVLEACRARKDCGLTLSEEVIASLCAAAPPERFGDLSESRLQALDQCLEQLAPRARTIVDLRYRQAHAPAEIADRMDWTTEAVHVALSKARTMLRDCVRRRLAATGDT
jgi:RNA polymerase sigma-70 factor (ECF subfamily)